MCASRAPAHQRRVASLSLSLSHHIHPQVISDLSKALDDVVKKRERLVQKQRQIVKDLDSTGREIQAFQNAKQQQLNKFTAFVNIETNQLKCLRLPRVEGDEPDDGDAAMVDTTTVDPSQLELFASAEKTLVFSNKALVQLNARIESLGGESSANRQLLRDLHKKQGVLNRKIKVKERENAGLEKDAVDIQVLRFGHEINMDSFAQMRDSSEVIELHAKVERIEAENEAKLLRWQRCVSPAFSPHARARARTRRDERARSHCCCFPRRTTTFVDPTGECAKRKRSSSA